MSEISAIGLTDQELIDTLGAHKHNHPIQIVAKCHEGVPMVVLFDAESSSIILVCPQCKTPVTRIAVAKSVVH